MLYLQVMKNYDFVAIGDIVTDAFIRLKDAEVHCDIDKSNCKISMRFGDKIPYEDVVVVPAVGNSPNACASATRLGLSSALITNIGDDQNGRDILEALDRNGIGQEFVSTHKGMKTNYHYVLWYLDDRTILVKHEAFPYNLPDIGNPKWIYLSSLGEHSLPFHDIIADWLEEHPDTNLAFQPGTFQMKLGAEKLARIYKNTKVFFCNREEAGRILHTKDDDIKSLLSGIKNLGPKIVVITDGPKGAYALDEENTPWHMPIYPDPKPPVDRTGAGDSFASTFTSALALGKTVPEALSWGPINSMSVVQYVGAQEGLLSKADLLRFLDDAPEDYIPTKI